MTSGSRGASAYACGVVARALVVLACVTLVVLLGVRLRQHTRCDRAGMVLFDAAVLKRNPQLRDKPGNLTHAARTLSDDCIDATTIAAGAESARFAGRSALAVQLGATATTREPDSFVAWAALGDVRRAAGDEIGAARAYQRAKQLNPRWAQPSLRLPGAASRP